MAEDIHPLNRKQIFRKALEARAAGVLYDRDNSRQEDCFRGSIDRFCEIAEVLRGCRRVLDVGAGTGLLLSLLRHMGHECFALDVEDIRDADRVIFPSKIVEFTRCNVEVDPIPYPDGFFDAVVCAQTLEHFTYSHLAPVREMRRVLRVGGILEVDVPNAVCWRNRSRILRGKQITWDYRKHYLLAEPVLYKGKHFFPDRHNRDFTLEELRMLLLEAGFQVFGAHYLKSPRYRQGLDSLRSLASAVRDCVPSFRKSIIAFGRK
ncbi:MAG: class I SAM-dependent methyltransferase [Deltaproteobacteria bacterium]|nr:MAG: class I SAM-dependent methyltransferase [Deltaproteobacteria bacterium]